MAESEIFGYSNHGDGLGSWEGTEPPKSIPKYFLRRYLIHKEILYLCVVYFSGHEHVAAGKHGPYLIHVIKGEMLVITFSQLHFSGAFQ